ncbi:hypothetical protein [Streptomyces sp. MST-110588]|uniref:hypothetical protein n=1 Tax=Streptomyces sp. MST-110588 TaxID=2833628 RepID=UPI001F5D6C90|nr:hypothetical protein [Streptomyces sp. MST-110588]UNO41511.1 hypothetical protein KGS77_20500 [Streptomyces sp. MST-110588]
MTSTPDHPDTPASPHTTPRRTRTRIAALSTLPTLLTVPLCALLATAGTLPWSVPLSVLLALCVQALITYTRLSRKANATT